MGKISGNVEFLLYKKDRYIGSSIGVVHRKYTRKVKLRNVIIMVECFAGGWMDGCMDCYMYCFLHGLSVYIWLYCPNAEGLHICLYVCIKSPREAQDFIRLEVVAELRNRLNQSQGRGLMQKRTPHKRPCYRLQNIERRWFSRSSKQWE